MTYFLLAFGTMAFLLWLVCLFRIGALADARMERALKRRVET